MHRGYIKLWRKSFENPFYLSEPFTKWQAWQDLILLANYTDKYATFRGVSVLVKRGQAAVGEQFLADRWQWKSRGKVKRFLNLLETRQQIVQQNSNVITLISISNYNEYQPNDTANDTASEQQVNSKRAASEQQTDTPKKVKKGNKYSAEFEEFWEAYPRKTGKGGAFNAWKKANRPKLDVILKSLELVKNTEQWKKEEGQFIPHAQTWINQARWDDITCDTKAKQTDVLEGYKF